MDVTDGVKTEVKTICTIFGLALFFSGQQLHEIIISSSIMLLMYNAN